MTHYHDALFNYTDKLLRKRFTKYTKIERSGITEITGPRSLIIPIRHNRRQYLIHYFLNDKWTIERNAWELGKRLYTRIKEDRFI